MVARRTLSRVITHSLKLIYNMRLLLPLKWSTKYIKFLCSGRDDQDAKLQLSPSTDSKEMENKETDDGMRVVTRSFSRPTRKYLRCFPFCILIIFFLFKLYQPAYNEKDFPEATEDGIVVRLEEHSSVKGDLVMMPQSQQLIAAAGSPTVEEDPPEATGKDGDVLHLKESSSANVVLDEMPQPQKTAESAERMVFQEDLLEPTEKYEDFQHLESVPAVVDLIVMKQSQHNTTVVKPQTQFNTTVMKLQPQLHATVVMPKSQQSTATTKSMPVTETPVLGWSQNTTRDLRVWVQPDDDTSVIAASKICSFHKGNESRKAEKKGEDDGILLLIIVCSSVANFEARQAIRETWASEAVALSARVAFLLGKPAPPFPTDLEIKIHEESRLHSDIIQESFVDSYNNLTIKSVMLLKWASRHCLSASYILKTDDDMFVNIGTIVTHLQERVRERKKLQQEQGLVATDAGQSHESQVMMAYEAEDTLLEGFLVCRSAPILNSNSKWYVPKYMFPETVYPNYLSGTGYLMSRSVAKGLYSAALSISLVHMEDVFVTGICARVAGLHPTNHPSFNYEKIKLDDPCGYNQTFTVHHVQAADLRLLWPKLKSSNLNCSGSSPSTGQPVYLKPINTCS